MNILKQLIISACYLALVQNNSYADDLIKDQLIETAHYENGDVIPYMLTATESTKVRYVLMVMPGGVGYLDPELRDGKVWFKAAGNFLIRSRALFVDSESVVISTNSTGSPERMIAIVNDALKRYPNSKVYVIGTSRSTISTMRLAEKLDGKVAGFIHTASMGGISRFDTRKLIRRLLSVDVAK